LRVSTNGQTADNQRLSLETVCEQRGVEAYGDNCVSDAKGRSQRPSLDAPLKDARGRFNVVLALALDRLGRSLLDLLDTLSELEAAGLALAPYTGNRHHHARGGEFAEFEWAMIRSRARADLNSAPGVRLGRPRIGARVLVTICSRLGRAKASRKSRS
jgi:DNA invertase Pin-like site-specific DNA recombinase